MSSQASLVYTSEDGIKQDLILDHDEESTIGRHPGCTLTVGQPSVSRKHARFWFEKATGMSLICRVQMGPMSTIDESNRKNCEKVTRSDVVTSRSRMS